MGVSPRVGRLVWPAMIVAGLGLAALVWVAWPEPTSRIIRLPYGEAMPKTPRDAETAARPKPAQRLASATAAPRPHPAASIEQQEAPDRVLAVLEPEDSSAGLPPVPSELELDGRYEQESPEELGAEPLPGADLTQPPTPAAG